MNDAPDRFRSRLTPCDGYVPTDAAHLYYREIGEGQPIIVLHGGPDFDHHYLIPDMDRLADSFRLIYYDQRGRGESATGVDPERISIASEVDDLEIVRRHFGLESTTILGHSWGAILAMEYAVRKPEHLSRLILMNPAPASHDDFQFFKAERRKRSAEDLERMTAIASTESYRAGDLGTEVEYYQIHFAAAVRRREHLKIVMDNLRVGATPEGVLRARAIEDRLYDETLRRDDYDLLPHLKEVTIPTLVMHGDCDFFPFEVSAHIAEAIPSARLELICNCGHFSYLEQPKAVSEAICGFMRDV